MSKGSRPRPIKDRKKFDDNWDSIFGKRREKDKTGICPTHHQYVHSRYQDEVQHIIDNYIDKFKRGVG